MNVHKRLRKWWLYGWHRWDAFLASCDRGLGFALRWFGGTVRHATSVTRRLRYLPALEQLERRDCPATPVVTGVSPGIGPVTGGTAILINGSGFSGITEVDFGTGHPAGFTVISSTEIEATSPAEPVGQVDIVVINGSGASAITSGDAFEFTNTPSISGLSPSQGTTSSGTAVLISGENLGSVTGVSFGGTAASFSFSQGQLSAVAPAHAAGVVDVRLTTASGSTAITSSDKYTYFVPLPVVSRVSPATGSTDGGDQVVITGTAFTGATAVTVGGNPVVAFHVDSDTQITATTPPGTAGVADILVTTAGGTSVAGAQDHFAYIVPAPAVTGLNPATGSTDGGQVVTISGTDFTSVLAVVFGDTPAPSFTVVSATTISATTPAEPAAVVDVRVLTPAGESPAVSGDQFHYAVPAPAVTGLSPASGPTSGGNMIVISGTDFQGASAVTFGAVAAPWFLVQSATAIEATVPAGSPGAADVRVTTSVGRSAVVTSDRYMYVVPVPAVTDVLPASGSTAGGDLITILGDNLDNTSQVFFGATPATNITLKSPTEVTVNSPAHGAGIIDITLVTPGGQSVVSTSDQFSFLLPVATVTGVSPAGGSTDGGQTLTLTGSNFSNASEVLFGGVAAPSFTLVSATKITVTTPGHLPGSIDVSVVTPSGTSQPGSGDKFDYVTPTPVVAGISVNSGSTAGGTTVVLSGTDLEGATKVVFGAVAAPFFSVDSPTQISVTAPAQAAGAVNITVTTLGGTSATASSNRYTYVEPAPLISGLSPASGSSDGGEVITISGEFFSGSSAVAFGSAAATAFTIVSDSEISATVPAGNPGTVTVTITNPAGTSAAAQAAQFEYVLMTPAVTGVSPDSGSTAGGSTITITGQNLAGASAVEVGGTPVSSFTVESPTEIIATTAAGSAGSGDVTVTTPAGTSPASAGDQFSYITVSAGTQTSTQATTSPGAAAAAAGAYASGNAPSLAAITGAGFLSPGGLALPLAAFGPSGLAAMYPADYDANGPITSTFVFDSSSTYTTSADGYSGSFSYYFHATVKDASGAVISSYTATSSGTFSSTFDFTMGPEGQQSGTASTKGQGSSSDSWSQNIAANVGTGQGSNFTAGSLSVKDSGSNHSSYKYDDNTSYATGATHATGTSSHTAGGGASWSDTAKGSYGCGDNGGVFTGSWQEGVNGSSGYSTHETGSLGSNGIWMSSGQMTNHGAGTSYSSTTGNGVYSISMSTSSGWSSSSTVVHQSADAKASYHYQEKTSIGTAAQQPSDSGTATSTNTHKATSASAGHGASGYTLPGGAGGGSDTWSGNAANKSSSSEKTSSTLGSDGIWVSTGTVTVGGANSGQYTYAGKSGYKVSEGVASGSWETGSVHTASAGNEHWAGKYHDKTPFGSQAGQGGQGTSGTTSYKNTGSSTSTYGQGGKYGYAVTGGNVKGTWAGAGHAAANFADSTQSNLTYDGMTGGVWITTGSVQLGGSGASHSSYTGNGSYTIKNGTSGKGSWDSGTVAVKEAGAQHGSYGYGEHYTLNTQDAWETSAGATTSASAGSSTSATTGAGSYGYTLPAGKVQGAWANHDASTVNYGATQGSNYDSTQGVWVPSGSLTVTESNHGNSSYSGTGSSVFASHTQGGDANAGTEVVTESGNDHWDSTDTEHSTLGASVIWQLTSGTSSEQTGGSSASSYHGSGTYKDVFSSGSSTGTWAESGSTHYVYTTSTTSGVNNGLWVTATDAMTEAGGSTASSSYTGAGSYTVAIGTKGKGSWETGSVNFKDSGSDKSTTAYHYNQKMGTSDMWETTAGASSSTSANSSNSTTSGKGDYGTTSAAGQVQGTWTSNGVSKHSQAGNESSNLGSDGVWVPAGSMTVTSLEKAKDTYAGKGSYQIDDNGANGTATTGNATSTSAASSASTSASSAGYTLGTAGWKQTAGSDSYHANGSSKSSFSEAGTATYVVAGVSLTGPWKDSASNNANFSTTMTLKLGANGKWTSSGSEHAGGSVKTASSSSASGSHAISSGTQDSGSWQSGSISIKESNSGKASSANSIDYELSGSGAWHTTAGSSSSTSASTSKSTTSAHGSYGSNSASGASHGSWTQDGKESSSSNGNAKSILGSDGIWVTSGSITLNGSDAAHSSYAGHGSYKIPDYGSSASWQSGSGTSSQTRTSAITNTYSAKYSLDASDNFIPTSGTASSEETSSSKGSASASGSSGQTVPGGSVIGTWTSGQSNQSSNTATTQLALGTDGAWSTTGSDTGSDSASWSSSYGGQGAYSISITGDGGSDSGSGTISESGADHGAESDTFVFALASGGTWQVVSGSASSTDSGFANSSDAASSNYSYVYPGGGSLSGTRTDSASDDTNYFITMGYILASDGTWIVSSLSSGSTETITGNITDTFSGNIPNSGGGGSTVSGSSSESLNEVLSSTNGSTAAVTSVSETAHGSFNLNGVNASFSIDVPTATAGSATITESNTSAFSDLPIQVGTGNDLASLNTQVDCAVANALGLASGSGGGSAIQLPVEIMELPSASGISLGRYVVESPSQVGEGQGRNIQLMASEFIPRNRYPGWVERMIGRPNPYNVDGVHRVDRIVEVRWDRNHPGGAHYDVTYELSDGSTQTRRFWRDGRALTEAENRALSQGRRPGRSGRLTLRPAPLSPTQLSRMRRFIDALRRVGQNAGAVAAETAIALYGAEVAYQMLNPYISAWERAIEGNLQPGGFNFPGSNVFGVPLPANPNPQVPSWFPTMPFPGVHSSRPNRGTPTPGVPEYGTPAGGFRFRDGTIAPPGSVYIGPNDGWVASPPQGYVPIQGHPGYFRPPAGWVPTPGNPNVYMPPSQSWRDPPIRNAHGRERAPWDR